MLTQERLKELFYFDDEIGHFRRKEKFQKFDACSVAGGPSSDGYIRISIDNDRYREHRLVWLYFNGSLPDGNIDHIDQDKLNNRICNLRIANESENGQNISSSNKNNCLKIRGVRKHSLVNKYQARIKLNYKEIYLGLLKR